MMDQETEKCIAPQNSGIDFDVFIRIRCNLGQRAADLKLGGAWRLWSVCRMIDKTGSGVVSKQAIVQTFSQINVNRSSLARWIGEALKHRFFQEEIKRRNGTVHYKLSGETAVAARLGLESVDNRYLYVNAKALFSPGWHSLVWEGYLTVCHHGKIISRQTLGDLTGVERHRQRRLEKGTGIQNTMNFVETDLPASHANGMREQGHNAFVYNGKVVLRLPDTRTSAEISKIGGRGRSKQINANLKRLSNTVSEFPDAGLGRTKSDPVKIFFNDPQKADRSLRKYGRQDKACHAVFVHQGEYARDNVSKIWKKMS